MATRTTAQDVMRCHLCETAVVQMHCDTCLVNLCKACVGEHFSANLSKPHKIVDFKDRKSTPLYPDCSSHDKEQCKMFCKQCDIHVCIYCLAADQHLKHELVNILKVLDEKKTKVIKEQSEFNDKIYPAYQDIASDIQKRISQLEQEYGEISIAITKHGENWHRVVDKLVRKLNAEVDETKNKQLETLQTQLDGINTKIADIEDEINSADSTLDSNDISKVLSVTSNLKGYKRLPPKFVTSKSIFIPGSIQEGELSELFGTLILSPLISIKKQGYSMRKQLLDKPETITTIDIEQGMLYNVVCLNDEEIWTSGNDKTMKLFNIGQGTLLKSIRTKSGMWPTDIAVTQNGDLVYTDYSHRTVNIVKKNNEIEEVIRLQNWKPLGVCSTSCGDLLVTMVSDETKQSKAVRYSGSIEKQNIQFDDKGQPLFSSSSDNKHICENRNLDICVSDFGAGAVVVVNQAGKLKFRYTGHTPAPKNNPFHLLRIATDSQSHILTADYDNHCVHIVDQDGKFLCYIVCGLLNPCGLCTDSNDNLLVAESGNRQVKKIKYQK